MNKILISIPHTGTNSLKKILGGEAVPLPCWVGKTLPQEPNSLYYGHSYKEHLPLIEQLSGVRMYSPMRDPVKSILTSIHHARHNANVGRQVSHWELFVERFLKFKPRIIPVENMDVKENSRGNYPLKAAYESEDYDSIKAIVKPYLDRLLRLKPFLQSVGYERLPWYSW